MISFLLSHLHHHSRHHHQWVPKKICNTILCVTPLLEMPMIPDDQWWVVHQPHGKSLIKWLLGNNCHCTTCFHFVFCRREIYNEGSCWAWKVIECTIIFNERWMWTQNSWFSLTLFTSPIWKINIINLYRRSSVSKIKYRVYLWALFLITVILRNVLSLPLY